MNYVLEQQIEQAVRKVMKLLDLAIQIAEKKLDEKK